MSIAKVIEVLAEGDTIEEAAQDAVTEASKTVKNIKHVYLQEIQAPVENNRVSKFRVNAKITFIVGSDS
jgi:flavin-binding protein dodecin